MKLVDIMPIIIVIAAIIINIAIGVNNEIGFSELMIRCIIVTIVFSIFGYLVTETLRNALEFSKINKRPDEKEENGLVSEKTKNVGEKESLFDIKVPPLDNEEFIGMSNDDNDEFIEVNPVDMGNYNRNVQD